VYLFYADDVPINPHNYNHFVNDSWMVIALPDVICKRLEWKIFGTHGGNHTTIIVNEVDICGIETPRTVHQESIPLSSKFSLTGMTWCG
jgi:hypothetical protein